MRRLSLICAVLAVAGMASPVASGHDIPAAEICYGCGADTIYGLTNLIAYLEANPDVDDGIKAPIIARARARILKLRAAGFFAPSPAYPAPCCYSRRPVYIR